MRREVKEVVLAIITATMTSSDWMGGKIRMIKYTKKEEEKEVKDFHLFSLGCYLSNRIGHLLSARRDFGTLL